MNKMQLHNKDNRFEMAVAIEEDSSLPSHGDAYITLQVSSNGFSGSNDLWVSAQALNEFCKALVSVERELKGEAKLESLSPNELKLRVFPASSLGHIALEGRSGYSVRGEHGSYWHEVAFGFEFELSQLSSAISQTWVKASAG